MTRPQTSPKAAAPKRPAKDLRAADLAMIHMAAKRLFGEVGRGSAGRDDYENWLQRHTGKRSAGDLTADERIAFVKVLRREGLLKERGAGGVGKDRPTTEQWSHLGGMARQMGWPDGLEDPGLAAFVKRTAKVSHPRFLTRSQASAVITGLRNWLGQKAAQEGRDAVS
jgi:hypothetical protein